MEPRLLSLTSLFLLSCQTLSQSYLQSSAGVTAQAPSAVTDAEVTQIQKQVTEGHCTEAFQAMQEFQKKPEAVQYLQTLNLMAGDCELQSEQYGIAEKNLREVTSFALGNQPKLAAQAYLLLSYVYEGLGDDSKALSAALDAERLSSFLSVPSRLAEVPARLAMLYSQMNDLTQAALYLTKADEGVRVLKTQNPQILGSIFWAQIYYQMGFKSLEQIDDQSISASIQGLMAIQKYSLKSLEFDDPTWSKRAFQQLQKNYLTLWNLIEKSPLQSSPLWSADEFKMKERKSGWLAELIELTRQADLFRPVQEQLQTKNTSEIYQFLSALEIAPFDETAAEVFGSLRAWLTSHERRRGPEAAT